MLINKYNLACSIKLNTSVLEFYKNETSEMHSTFKEAVKTNFHNYNVFTSNHPSMGPLLSLILQYIDHSNMTHTENHEQIYYIPHIIQTIYGEYNVSEIFHEGTSTNIAVMDLEDNYVSLIMYKKSLLRCIKNLVCMYIF